MALSASAILDDRAWTTHPEAPPVPMPGERMTVEAVRLSSVRQGTASEVLVMGHRLAVLGARPDAESVPAHVIYFQPIRDGAYQGLMGEAVGKDVLPERGREPSVSRAFAAASFPSPDPATITLDDEAPETGLDVAAFAGVGAIACIRRRADRARLHATATFRRSRVGIR